MKQKILRDSVVQSFIFNLILCIVFLGVGLYYMLPKHEGINQKKEELITMNDSYSKLKTQGLDYEAFTNYHEELGEVSGLNQNVYLQNVLKDFGEQDYREYFFNPDEVNYDQFLKESIRGLESKKEGLESQGISESIKNVLPYYTIESSVSDDALTDFKFVNYIENLLHTFNLQGENSIGIGTLTPVNEFEGETINQGGDDAEDVKNITKQLDRKIYSSKLKLSLEGKKKNIINFIHYVENVGQISIEDGVATIKSTEKTGSFSDIRRSFIASSLEQRSGTGSVELDIYNNLVMDIEKIEFKDYIDSSESTSGRKYPDFVTYLKKTQGDETYELDIILNFYVRGLPAYKIEEFTKSVLGEYKDLQSLVKQSSAYIAINKSKLRSTGAVAAKNNMEKFNRYLSGIKKDIDTLTKDFKRKKNLEQVNTMAAEYNRIFSTIKGQLAIDLKEISPKIYEKNKEFLGTKSQ